MSNGNPSEKRMYSDILCVYAYLISKLNIPSCNIIAIGESIGSVSVVHLTTCCLVGGVVLVAAPASAVRCQIPQTPSFDMLAS